MPFERSKRRSLISLPDLLPEMSFDKKKESVLVSKDIPVHQTADSETDFKNANEFFQSWMLSSIYESQF